MRDTMIETYIGQLSASLGGVRRPIEQKKLRALYDRKDFVGIVNQIKTGLGLTMHLKVGFVNKGGDPRAAAWVHPPGQMPFYGTRDFDSMSITMYIRKEFLRQRSLESIVLAIAHELSHIVLGAIKHPLKQEEEAVDLTAMMLGYRDFYLRGSVWTDALDPLKDLSFDTIIDSLRDWREKITTPRIYQLGYLKLDEICFASEIMRKLEK